MTDQEIETIKTEGARRAVYAGMKEALGRIYHSHSVAGRALAQEEFITCDEHLKEIEAQIANYRSLHFAIRKI